MRYRTALLLFFSVGAAAAQQVAVFLQSDRNAPALVLNSLRSEVEDVIAPSGIHISWHAMEASEFSQVYETMAVMRLRGECRPDAPAANGKPGVLGETHIVEGKVLPIADIRCDSVRGLISRDLRGASADKRDQLLGRALGRVIAHELFHIVLRTRDHGHDGLARAAQSSADLIAERRRFSPPEEERLSESSTDSGR
jgi:hypothetical protein